MDDDAHDLDDLTPQDGDPDGPDGPLAVALHRALDGRRTPDPVVVLARVQSRAARHHRRRLGMTGAAVAASVAAVALVAPAVGAGGRAPGPQRLAAPAVGGPAEPTPSAPATTDDAEAPMGRSLSLDEVQALLPGAPLVDVRAPSATGDDLVVDEAGALCTDDGVRYPSPPSVLGTGLWGPGAAATATSAGSVQERLLGWTDAEGARAYVQVVAGTASGCQDAGPATTAVTDGHGGVVATTATGPGRWRVRVVAAVGGDAVDVSADVAASSARDARDRVSAVWRAAASRVPALAPDGQAPPADPAAQAAQAAAAAQEAADAAAASASVAALTPHMMTHGPDPRG